MGPQIGTRAPWFSEPSYPACGYDIQGRTCLKACSLKHDGNESIVSCEFGHITDSNDVNYVLKSVNTTFRVPASPDATSVLRCKAYPKFSEDLGLIDCRTLRSQAQILARTKKMSNEKAAHALLQKAVGGTKVRLFFYSYPGSPLVQIRYIQRVEEPAPLLLPKRII